MKCPRCLNDNRAPAKFCGHCGASLGRTCAACGSPLSPSAKFCPECGGRADAAGESAGDRFASPESYTPRHLAERILTSRAALEGERKQVTVLFADLKGSMELLADRDPEEARRLLDPILELMIEAVHHYEGTVNQVMGDGIMALFGAPLAHEDHAVRACYAALRMQERVRRHAEANTPSHGIPIRIRIGLNSGEVVVRSIGNDLHMDYTAVGQTTHLAARMEQMADPGSILATANTLGLVKGYVEARSLGRLSVKGLHEGVDVSAIVGPGVAHWPMEAAAARGLTGFVGREDELGQLRSAMESAAGGRGQVVGVVGEPGVGKSRLFYEFTQRERMPGWRILKTGAASYGKATAYRPVIDLLRAYFEIHDRGDAQEVRETITGKVLALDQKLASMLPALLSLLDVPVEDAQWQALDPRQRRQQTMEAVRRLVLRESQGQPLCLVFEDLHWIDSETQAFLDSLIVSLPTARVLLLVNYRPEYRHEWGSKSYYTQLRVDPLPPRSAEELLRLLLGDAGPLAPLKQLLIEQTRGNPFFLEESVRMKVEDGSLVGERGAYRLTKPVSTFRVPATVETVLAARIDRLAPEDKRLLQAASVIGENVPVGLLQAVAEMPESELRDGLARLRAAEFLYDISLFAEPHYVFTHGLTCLVAYNSLLRDRQRALHARIVEGIERLYPERLGEHVERLAHHAYEGEAWPKACTYLQEAGRKAYWRCAHQEAAAFFERGLDALAHLPDGHERTERAIDLRFELRNTLQPLGDFPRIASSLHEAEVLVQGLEDRRRLAQVSAYLADYFRYMGEHDRAIEYGRRALAIADTLGDLALWLRTRTYLGQTLHACGDYRGAAEFLQANVDALEGDRARESLGFPQLPSVHSRTCMVWCLSELGEFAEGVRRGEEAVRIAESVEHPFTLATACAGLGSVHVRRGTLEVGIPILERSLELCRTWHLSLWLPRVAAWLGEGLIHAGRVSEAIPLLEQAVRQWASMRLTGGHAPMLVELGEAYLLAGRVADARETAERGLALAREHKERGHEAWALRLAGEIALRSEPAAPDAVRAHLGEALRLATELSMRPLAARCRLGLGRAHAQAGEIAAAREHLGTAAALFGEMQMRLWLVEAEAVLAGLLADLR